MVKNSTMMIETNPLSYESCTGVLYDGHLNYGETIPEIVVLNSLEYLWVILHGHGKYEIRVLLSSDTRLGKGISVGKAIVTAPVVMQPIFINRLYFAVSGKCVEAGDLIVRYYAANKMGEGNPDQPQTVGVFYDQLTGKWA